MKEPQNGDVVKIIHYTDHGRKGVSIGMLQWVRKDDTGTYIKLSGHINQSLPTL